MKFIFKKRGWYNIILTLSLLVFCVQPLVVAQDVGNEIIEQTEEDKARIKAIEERFGKKWDQITKEEWHKETQREWEEILRVMAGRYILQGEVVDEQGMRLNGVEVKIDKHGKDLDRGNQEPEWIINGTFNLDIKGYINLRLWFSKDGYYSENLDFGFKDKDISPEVYRAIEEGKKVESPLVLKKEDIRVVLEKQGKLTDLIDYSGALEYATTGKGVIINFDIPGGSLGTPRRRVENLEDPKQLPENCVYMIAEKEWDGSIATVQKFRTRKDLWGKELKAEYIVPQRIKLIMTAPDSGFIRFKPDPNKKMPRQMKEAPDVGYQKELVLDAADFIIDDSTGTTRDVVVPIYFKVKDKYGKGEVSGSELYDDNSRIRIGVAFNLQPDGSRNLETGD